VATAFTTSVGHGTPGFQRTFMAYAMPRATVYGCYFRSPVRRIPTAARNQSAFASLGKAAPDGALELGRVNWLRPTINHRRPRNSAPPDPSRTVSSRQDCFCFLCLSSTTKSAPPSRPSSPRRLPHRKLLPKLPHPNPPQHRQVVILAQLNHSPPCLEWEQVAWPVALTKPSCNKRSRCYVITLNLPPSYNRP
jgi:hypothetical protein